MREVNSNERTLTSFSLGTETHLKEKQVPSTDKCVAGSVGAGKDCGSFVYNDMLINEKEILYLYRESDFIEGRFGKIRERLEIGHTFELYVHE